jgi:4-hydroxybenzoate polyprenyltransferase
MTAAMDVTGSSLVGRDETPPPLAVDLDGTLILSDTLHEGLAAYLKADPKSLLGLMARMREGKAAFKRHVSASVGFDPALLCYNQEFLDYLRAQRAAGRHIGLFTAADQSIADAVSAHLGLFDVARGSTGIVNLGGAAKLAVIEAEFGPRFAYAGDHAVDQPIFARAAGVVLVGQVESLRAGLEPGAVVEASFPVARPGPAVWTKALRLKHWTKNALVFAPAALAPPGWTVFLHVGALFVLLGVLASATYLINDLMDLEADRRHVVKRHRPLAAGTLSVRDAVLAAGGMIVAALLVSLLLPGSATLMLLSYLGLTLLYSFVLKRMPMVDVVVLAGLFTLRVLAGALQLNSPVSPWLLTFSMLFFLSLAIIKRYAELERLVQAAFGKAAARGYTARDMPILLASGIGAAFSAIVICMIYLINEQYSRAVYTHPQVLWGVMPVLLVWMLRLWHLAVHDRMSEDPVMFAMTDRTSQVLGLAVAVIMIVSRL